MEAILEPCDLTDKQRDSINLDQNLECKNTKSTTLEAMDFLESTVEQISKNKTLSENNKNKIHNISSKYASSIDNDSETKVETESKNLNISFDEDIILPSVRHDPSSDMYTKQRDRVKRKEMRSRKELEEEEREKMQ